MKRIFVFCLVVCMAAAADANVSKLSPLVREAASVASYAQPKKQKPETRNQKQETITAFVKADDVSVLKEYGCKIYADWGDLFIAGIPLDRINALSDVRSVHRIAAGRPMSLTNDTTAVIIGTSKVRDGFNLPQAFRGTGVVIGVQDIGFDFTHPTFKGRIRKVWDMLSRDTTGSTLPVGREYDETELSLIQHSYDAYEQTHGTHTTGSAAGSGYEGKHSGMAPECDIVMVSALFGDNQHLVDSADLYKYTDALDILGYKYMFDYAESQGKPCVVSYSAGSPENFLYEDIFLEAIGKLVGPGKIFVTSAGNNGNNKTYIKKDDGQKPDTIRLTGNRAVEYFVKSSDFVVNSLYVDTVKRTYTPEQIFEQSDGMLKDTILTAHGPVHVTVQLYPSCFDGSQYVFDITVDTTLVHFDYTTADADAAVYVYSGSIDDSRAEALYNCNFPACSPDVISVGATGYVTSHVNYKGELMEYDGGKDGELAFYSSHGPTYFETIKPDIVAPGSNIVSSYSSFYLEQNPDANDIRWDVEHFGYEGRIYPWNSNAGTSMSAPIVAGSIALWLQANPLLTKEDIIDVFAHTASHHDPSLEYPNVLYGYGEIDTYHGLLYILGLEGIVSPRMVSPSVFPLREGETMTIYTIDGKQTDKMEHGIYAIQIKSTDPSRSGSMLIRK